MARRRRKRTSKMLVDVTLDSVLDSVLGGGGKISKKGKAGVGWRRREIIFCFPFPVVYL